MGKYLKMADVFGGAVTANHKGDFNGWSIVETSLGLSIDESGDGGFEQRAADYVAHAINSHDELVAEVERLRVIIDIKPMANRYNNDIDDFDNEIIMSGV